MSLTTSGAERRQRPQLLQTFSAGHKNSILTPARICNHFPMRPIALTIAGSDSGGGAGIQADLRVFALLGVHGATAITCLTAQNRKAVSRIQAVSPKMVRAQLEAVFAESAPNAAKTGMLYSAGIVREIVSFLKCAPPIPLVVDPVMIATSGASLLQGGALKILQTQLLPLAALVTPNRAEAEVLVGREIRSPEDLRAAARSIHSRFGCAALVKGGHLPATNDSIDILFDGQNEWMLSAPRVRGVRLHGTGCVYSAAITAALAKGKPLAVAVQIGKDFVTRHILASRSSPWDSLIGTGSVEAPSATNAAVRAAFRGRRGQGSSTKSAPPSSVSSGS